MSYTPCPLCGVLTRPPPGASWELPHTPHTDECACTDRQTCFYHQSHLGEYPPARPSDEVMLERAQKQHAWKLAEHEKKMAKFLEYEKLRDEVTALKARVAELEELTREVAK